MTRLIPRCRGKRQEFRLGACLQGWTWHEANIHNMVGSIYRDTVKIRLACPTCLKSAKQCIQLVLPMTTLLCRIYCNIGSSVSEAYLSNLHSTQYYGPDTDADCVLQLIYTT